MFIAIWHSGHHGKFVFNGERKRIELDGLIISNPFFLSGRWPYGHGG
ncbi:hypothetical protein [Parageobacillus toebii]|nr:hypothetical protein [Parageobacillus toebii]QSB49566.1 hypothetical protein JTI59_04630 [Parageobacillus toebii]WMT19696.1 hypothetical protein RFB12_03575 [Parageobacillus toebii]